jgi:hypothetical protein
MLDTAVIPCGGRGTRLLPITSLLPKEILNLALGKAGLLRPARLRERAGRRDRLRVWFARGVPGGYRVAAGFPARA